MGVCKVWDLEYSGSKQKFKIHEQRQSANSITFYQDCNSILAGGNQGNVVFVDLRQPNQPMLVTTATNIRANMKEVSSLSQASQSFEIMNIVPNLYTKQLVALQCLKQQCIFVLDIRMPHNLQSVITANSEVACVSWFPNSNILSASTVDGQIKMWDTASASQNNQQTSQDQKSQFWGQNEQTKTAHINQPISQFQSGVGTARHLSW